MAQIDEIAVVGQDLLRQKTGLVTSRLEGTDGGIRQGGGLPLTLILGKEGKRVGPDGLGAGDGILHPAGRTDVGSDIFHTISSIRQAAIMPLPPGHAKPGYPIAGIDK